MPPQLVALTEGPDILLDKPILLIGRHQECDIQIPSRKISRRHCCMAQVDDHLVVRDLGSTNGISINGARVLEGSLVEGDELTIGNFRYQVRLKMVAEEARPEIKKKTTHAAGRLVSAGGEDDALESAEEPVPLMEPLETVPKPSMRSLPLPPAGQDLPGNDQGLLPPNFPSLVLPENIELAPASDELPPFPKPP